MHYDLEILPDDRGTLSKYNSDVCKWHLFVSNITEDVFQVLTETFALDYKRSPRFHPRDVVMFFKHFYYLLYVSRCLW